MHLFGVGLVNEWQVRALGRWAMELGSFSLAPRHAASQGESRLSGGYICLGDSSGALEADTVSSINFVFYTSICMYCAK